MSYHRILPVPAGMCDERAQFMQHPPATSNIFDHKTMKDDALRKGHSRLSLANSTANTLRNVRCRENEAFSTPSNIDATQSRSTSPCGGEGARLPDNKRRCVPHQGIRMFNPALQSHQNENPALPHSTVSARGIGNMFRLERPDGRFQVQPNANPSLKLSPPQARTTLNSPNVSRVEAAIKGISPLFKIKLLSRIALPLVPSFRKSDPSSRGLVIAVDGEDRQLVQIVVEHLGRLLKKGPKYQVRVFNGPDILSAQERPHQATKMGDAIVGCFNTICAWHRVSDDIINFVKSVSSTDSTNDRHAAIGQRYSGFRKPSNTIMPKTVTLQIESPVQSGGNGFEGKSSTFHTAGRHPCSIPVALVPRYQLSTANEFACSVPISDAYAPLDHWLWMASLWRACVGPDITVYIRECSPDELTGAGGSFVQTCLRDAGAVVLHSVVGTSKCLQDEALERIGSEIGDYLS